MPTTRKKSVKIRNYILDQIDSGQSRVAQTVSEKFGISTQAANRHLNHLIEENLIIATGRTRNRKYELKAIHDEQFNFEINRDLKEDLIWRKHINPIFSGLLDKKLINKNVFDICHYGFTEMFNNVIDHSKSSSGIVRVLVNVRKVELSVLDDGIGIFKNLQDHFNLEDERHAILELAKGKVTTAPDEHTGEGIFFTSRMLDRFSITSNLLSYIRSKKNDWLINNHDDPFRGTGITMSISNKSKRNMRQVFREYEDDDYGFTKTIVPVELAQFEGEKLISRSQAKRLLSGLNRFKVVMLDFKGVKFIGRAFTDEIFRVFKIEHPDVELVPVNMSLNVERSISSVIQISA